MKEKQPCSRSKSFSITIIPDTSVLRRNMLYLSLLLVPFLFLLLSASAQSDGYDKLRRQNADVLIQQANNLTKSNPDKALSLVESALSISYEKGDINSEAEAHFTRGNIHYYQGSHLLAIEAYNKAIPLFDRLGKEDRQLELLKFKALSLEASGNKTEALALYQKIFAKTNKSETGELLYKIASLQQELGQETKANTTFQQSYNFAKKTQDTVLMAKVSDVIDQGRDSAAWLGNVRQEVGYYQQQLKSKPQKRSKAAELNYNIGSRYLQQNKPEKAIEYLNNTVELSQEESYPDFNAPTTAVPTLDASHNVEIDSIEIPERNDLPVLFADSKVEDPAKEEITPIAEKERRGIEPPKTTDPRRDFKAKEETPNASDMPDKKAETEKKKLAPSGDFDSLVELRSATYRKLAEAYALERNYLKAWEFGQRALQEADSARRQEIQLLQSAATNREALALREQRIVTLEQDRMLQAEQLHSQRLLNFGLGALLIAIVLGGLLLWRIQRKRRRASQLLTLRSLVGQMNPHFIFNSLNTFNSYIATADTQKANRFLGDFSRLMRQVLEYSGHDFVPLSRELEILGLYLKLEHGRFAENFDYELNVSPDLDLDAIEIPPMLLQPYVENAIWHGLRYREDKGFLHVDILKHNNKTHIIIADNGIGRDKSQALKTHNQQQRSNSLGMKNTARRAELVQTLFKKRLSIEVNDQDPKAKNPGTQVKLTISD